MKVIVGVKVMVGVRVGDLVRVGMRVMVGVRLAVGLGPGVMVSSSVGMSVWVSAGGGSGVTVSGAGVTDAAVADGEGVDRRRVGGSSARVGTRVGIFARAVAGCAACPQPDSASIKNKKSRPGNINHLAGRVLNLGLSLKAKGWRSPFQQAISARKNNRSAAIRQIIAQIGCAASRAEKCKVTGNPVKPSRHGVGLNHLGKLFQTDGFLQESVSPGAAGLFFIQITDPGGTHQYRQVRDIRRAADCADKFGAIHLIHLHIYHDNGWVFMGGKRQPTAR